MRKKTCLNCHYYSIDSREEAGGKRLDFCWWYQKPLHAAYFQIRTLTSLEEMAESCPFYKKK
jgi:hypothetical protein